MTKWRYDVSFTYDDNSDLTIPSYSLIWSNFARAQSELKKLQPGQSLEFKEIPNKRIAEDVWASEQLHSFIGSVAELKELSKKKFLNAMDPDLLYSLADQLGLKVRIIWSMNNLAHLHALFEFKNDPIRNWLPDGLKMPSQIGSAHV